MNKPANPTTKRRIRKAPAFSNESQGGIARETERLRVALQQCAAPFVIKPAESDAIDWEGLAREFFRRMKLAGDALEIS